MAYFRDLSPYDYLHAPVPGAQNVGWLATDHQFPMERPLDSDLHLLWLHCRVAVNATRSLHACEFCEPGKHEHHFRRNGETLLLGFAEIRVFSPSGQSFAAPSLIYHYISDHHYRPPNSFLAALRAGPKPPSQAYFDELRIRGLEWDSAVRAESSPG